MRTLSARRCSALSDGAWLTSSSTYRARWTAAAASATDARSARGIARELKVTHHLGQTRIVVR